jgi:hypothetical protein
MGLLHRAATLQRARCPEGLRRRAAESRSVHAWIQASTIGRNSGGDIACRLLSRPDESQDLLASRRGGGA